MPVETLEGLAKNSMVLVVDDEQKWRDTLKKELLHIGFTHDNGYFMEGLSDGSSAVRRVREIVRSGGRIALVTMDKQMPGLSGNDTTDRIRNILPDGIIISVSEDNSLKDYPPDCLRSIYGYDATVDKSSPSLSNDLSRVIEEVYGPVVRD